MPLKWNPSDPPAIVAPAPDRLAAAVHAQAAKPGVLNPNGPAWWQFDSGLGALIPAEKPPRRARSQEEYAAIRRASTCGICVTGFPVTGANEGYVSCIRLNGHGGPHVIHNRAGRFYCWEPDEQGEDPEDFIYWKIDQEQAEELGVIFP